MGRRRTPRKIEKSVPTGTGIPIVKRHLTLAQAVKDCAIPLGEHPNDAPNQYNASHKPIEGDDWDLGFDYDAAMSGLAVGIEPSEKFELATRRLDVIGEVTQAVYRFDVSGDEVDIGRYLAEEHECWLDPILESKQGISPMVEVLVSITASCVTDAALIQRRGAAVFALCEALETYGKAVGISLTSPNQANGSAHILDLRIRIKEPFERINKRRLAYLLTHPTVFRRLVFRLMEQLEPELKTAHNVHNGYGYVIDLPVEARTDASIYLETIGYTDERFETDERAKNWVRDTLVAQGITLG